MRNIQKDFFGNQVLTDINLGNIYMREKVFCGCFLLFA